MAMNIVALVMVLAITFMHSIFGFFSGIINAFCAIASAAIAFGFYEAVNDLVTKSFALDPGYTEPICFVALFLISVVALRTLADNYIRGNVKLPAALDFAGAAVCGFINAQIFVGVLVLGVQMLPLGGRVLGYSAWVRDEYKDADVDHPELIKFDRNHLWTRPDEFTAGLFKLISSGSLRGATTFASVYPDFPEAVFFSTNTVQRGCTPSPYRKERGHDADGFTKGLRVEGWWVETGPIEGRYRREVPTERDPTPDYERVTFKPAPGKKLIGTQLRLNQTAADRDKRSPIHLFRPTMLRLVGQANDTPQQYPARIIANADPRIEGRPRITDYDNNFSLPGGYADPIYAYFEVDEDFRPAFVEYRRHARAAVPAQPEEEPEIAFTLAGETGDRGDRDRGRGDRGNLTFGRVLEAGSNDNRNLPFTMMRRAFQGSGDVTLDGEEFVSGRISGSRARLEHSGDAPRVQYFKLPEGRRLMQVCYKPKRVQSIVSQVFNYVGGIVNQYYIVDNNANRYPLSGYYGIVTRARGEQYIELFYTGGPDDPLSASYNGMLDFKDIQRNEINDQDEALIGLLFLVPPDTEFVRVENQAGDGGDIRMRSNRD
jgi:hypothetical protein